MKRRLIELGCTFLLVSAMGAFVFWCGYRVGKFETECRAIQDLKMEAPYSPIGEMAGRASRGDCG